MPHLQAVVRPRTCCFWVQIADFTSPLQDNRTIAKQKGTFLCQEVVAENNGHADLLLRPFGGRYFS